MVGSIDRFSRFWFFHHVRGRLTEASENVNVYEVESSNTDKLVPRLSVPPGARLSSLGNLSRSPVGSQKIFKVYVVTTEDNEKGSNAVKVTHPEE